MSENQKPLDYETPVGAAQRSIGSAISGGILGAFATLVFGGMLAFSVQTSFAKLAGTLACVAGASAIGGGLFLLRSDRRRQRLFLAGICIGAGLMLLVEGTCFLKSGV